MVETLPRALLVLMILEEEAVAEGVAGGTYS
jgi:hypothetical protein